MAKLGINGALGAMLAAVTLAGCAGGPQSHALEEAGGGAPAAQVVASDAAPQAPAEDLLTQARRIASAKGYGAAPAAAAPPPLISTPMTANAASSQPTTAPTNAPAVPDTPADARNDEPHEDVMARIKLAALRMKAARASPADAARANALESVEAEDPREVFRRAQARARQQAHASPPERVFGKLIDENTVVPVSASATGSKSYFMEAMRLREVSSAAIQALGPLAPTPPTHPAGAHAGRMGAPASHAKLD